MGYAKVKKISDHKIKLLHQLHPDGTPYAENIIIELDESVDPSRLSYLASQDGKIGIASIAFSPSDESYISKDIQFPEE